MKITCAVEVSNRSYPSITARNQQKYQVATLALCHKERSKLAQGLHSDKDVLLILCTHSHPQGTKYKVIFFLSM